MNPVSLILRPAEEIYRFSVGTACIHDNECTTPIDDLLRVRTRGVPDNSLSPVVVKNDNIICYHGNQQLIE